MGTSSVHGGFDTHSLPPTPQLLNTSPDPATLIGAFLRSRRQGVSKRTSELYAGYLSRASSVVGFDSAGEDIAPSTILCQMLQQWQACLLQDPESLLQLAVFSQVRLRTRPAAESDSTGRFPKGAQKSAPMPQCRATGMADSAGRISLLADSGLRLSELADTEIQSIDWAHRIMSVKCKGNKEGFGPFGQRTEQFLREWLSQHKSSDRLWDYPFVLLCDRSATISSFRS